MCSCLVPHCQFSVKHLCLQRFPVLRHLNPPMMSPRLNLWQREMAISTEENCSPWEMATWAINAWEVIEGEPCRSQCTRAADQTAFKTQQSTFTLGAMETRKIPSCQGFSSIRKSHTDHPKCSLINADVVNLNQLRKTCNGIYRQIAPSMIWVYCLHHFYWLMDILMTVGTKDVWQALSWLWGMSPQTLVIKLCDIIPKTNYSKNL